MLEDTRVNPYRPGFRLPALVACLLLANQQIDSEWRLEANDPMRYILTRGGANLPCASIGKKETLAPSAISMRMSNWCWSITRG